MTGTIQSVGIAAFGGLMLNVMNLWEDSKKLKSDRVPKDTLYWIFFAAWPVVGGALSYIYLLDGSTLRPFLSFSVGLSAPATIKSLMSTAISPAGPPANSEG